MVNKFTLETRGGVSALICTHCNRPFLTIENGELKIAEKHGNGKHENTITIDHLRMLAALMFQQTHPPERW